MPVVNAKFLMDNAVDYSDTVITSSVNIVPTLPGSNVQLPQHTKVTRSTNTVGFSIDIDFSEDMDIDTVAIARHNLAGSDSWRVILYDGVGQTGTWLYDSGSIIAEDISLVDSDWFSRPETGGTHVRWGERKTSAVFFDQQSVRSASVHFTANTNPDGYVEVGRLFMGLSATPSINVEYGLSSGWQEDTKQFRTEGSTLRSDPKENYRTITLSMKNITQGERSGFSNLIREVGMKKDFFVSVFPDATNGQERDYMMACKFTSLPSWNNWVHDTYSTTFNLVEA